MYTQLEVRTVFPIPQPVKLKPDLLYRIEKINEPNNFNYILQY